MNNLTPEQIESLKQAIQQQIGCSSTPIQPGLLQEILNLLNQFPDLITRLITAPFAGLTTSLTGLINVIASLLGLLGSNQTPLNNTVDTNNILRNVTNNNN